MELTLCEYAGFFKKYVGEKYKSIMFKCEVAGDDLYGNRSDEDDEFYKDLTKDPDVRYMRLKLLKYLNE